MSQPAVDGRAKPPARAYRFLGFQVDLERRTLGSDLGPLHCQPLAFELLAALCEAGGRVVAREDLFARLWPDEEAPSDESLTQVVYRLRQCLGRSGGAVVTVRNLGFRLDAPIEALEAAERPPASPAPERALGLARPPGEAEGGAEAAPARTSGRRAAGRASWIAAALALGAAGIWVAGSRFGGSLLDSGYGLRSGDLGSARRETAERLEAALLADAAGERTKATALLEALHRQDPEAPLPALLLGLWSSAVAADEEAARWVAEGEARLAPSTPIYSLLFSRYARAAVDGDADRVAGALAALIELRPGAWRFRLARAHGAIARGERPSALADLRAIDLEPLEDRGTALVIADRASLGDLDGAERALAGTGWDPGRPLFLYTRGRIDRSRGRHRAAAAALGAGAERLREGGRTGLAAQAGLLAADALAHAGDVAGARGRLADLLRTVQGEVGRREAAAGAALGAALAAAEGDAAERDRLLAHAASLSAPGYCPEAASLTLLALRLGAAPPAVDAEALLPQRLPAELYGVRELLAARRAMAQGEAGSAARLLAEARRAGVEGSWLQEEGALLGADLGEPVPPLPAVDPPYPLPMRLAAGWELARRRASAGAIGG